MLKQVRNGLKVQLNIPEIKIYLNVKKTIKSKRKITSKLVSVTDKVKFKYTTKF